MLTAFLALSLCFQPLDLLWHAGQFPVWYPYRFSFIVSFWLIWLAAQTLTADFQPGWLALSLVTLIVVAGSAYVGVNLAKFKFLTLNQLLLGLLFVIFALALITLPIKHHWIYPLTFLVIGVTEVAANAFISLNNISYVSQGEYGNYTNELQRLVNRVQKRDHGFYRIGKTFLRTKEMLSKLVTMVVASFHPYCPKRFPLSLAISVILTVTALLNTVTAH
ncbi:YfhO family protein [Levilactobacillus brevis]|nr:YfhO family protein [Levilactobacillus brevis]